MNQDNRTKTERINIRTTETILERLEEMDHLGGNRTDKIERLINKEWDKEIVMEIRESLRAEMQEDQTDDFVFSLPKTLEKMMTNGGDRNGR